MLAKRSESEPHSKNGEKARQGWKRRISDLLKELGFIDKDFKGKVVIDINQGGTRSLDKNEKFE